MKLSVVLITKNSESKLEECLKSIKGLGDELVVLDTGSEDKTLEIARKYGAKIGRSKGKDFASWRNEAAKLSKGEWLFYIDYDERISPELAREIQETITNNDNLSGYDIPRKNFVFGKWLKHGGWYPDYVLRLIKKADLLMWEGEVHEQPRLRRGVGRLKTPLTHIKEDNLSDMVLKTNKYSEYEAKLLFNANHPPMTWWRFASVMIKEVWYRLFTRWGILDGTEGIIYCTYQGWSRFVTYVKLWELQQSKK